jgi:hypothetical protein
VTDFPPNSDMSDNRLSMCPQARYRRRFSDMATGLLDISLFG